MAGRGGTSRRVPENDTTIAYVQADGLVSYMFITYSDHSYYIQMLTVLGCYENGKTLP